MQGLHTPTAWVENFFRSPAASKPIHLTAMPTSSTLASLLTTYTTHSSTLPRLNMHTEAMLSHSDTAYKSDKENLPLHRALKTAISLKGQRSQGHQQGAS